MIRNRIYFLSLFFLFVISCKKSENISGGSVLPQKPNIILILADDVGYEIPTCNGGQSYQTPNIDMMAQQGMRFTQGHSTPLCSPSRFMLLTGKYNFRNYKQWGVMDLSNKTIANMLKDVGYKTACYGKWQLDGGDNSVKSLGFDNYAIFNAFNDDKPLRRYKDPYIYTNGSYISDSIVKSKYGEDIFTDSIIAFIDRNKANPFFVYYPMLLCHQPFQPTPDDAEYGTWSSDASDTRFFPSMVKYMDKKIGQVIDKVKSLGIEKNTVIILTGDNGTPPGIHSVFKGKVINGGKNSTTEYGTNVPLLIYCPGTVPGGFVNDDLIDFTDLLPTIADIAEISKPNNYGVLDGVDFYPIALGQTGTPREWIFCHFQPLSGRNNAKLERWVQNKTYKLYETGEFYNIVNDIFEKYPIADSILTNEEQQIKQEFQNVLGQMHN